MSTIFMIKVYVDDNKVFGDYKCVAHNHLGSLEQTINLQEGTKPEPPSKVSFFSCTEIRANF